MGRIFLVGAGSMAESFIKGVLGHPGIRATDISVINRNRPERLTQLAETYGIVAAHSFEEAADAETIILSVKPYDVRDALSDLLPYLHGQTLISFAAGIPIKFMEDVAEGRVQVIRTMPNVPVAVLEGAIAMAVSENVVRERIDAARQLLGQLGVVVELKESMMDAATAFSGSGPGFVSYFLEAMEDAAVELGFMPELARTLLIQTVVGTAKVLEEWRLSPAELRHRVTSPNGTTHAGLTVMTDGGVREAILAALRAAEGRSREMGSEYTREE